MSLLPDLDDARALAEADRDGMLRAVATATAQVREAAVLSAEAGVAGLADQGRPRTVVVCGMGGSGIAGDVLAAVAGASCPVPVLQVRGPVLPRWVGAADLVVAVSCSGRTQETLAALEEAVRRGCPVLAVAAPRSPLEALARRGRGVVVPVSQGRAPRASLWALAVPLLVAADALGMLEAGPGVLEETADMLAEVATRCRPDADAMVNPAKVLALELAGSLPVVWGASPLTGVAAYRFACQLNENAKTPGVWGVLPEAAHNQVVALDGSWAGSQDVEDLFRDRVDEPERPRVRLVLLREAGELPAVALRADVCAALAGDRGVGVSTVRAEGQSALARLASVVATVDFATTYLALLEGTDPTPVRVIDALKDRTER